MNVFLKYIGKSIVEKKSRLFLLIGCIAISIAFLIGTLSASDTLSDILSDQFRSIYGDYNIQINTSSESEEFLFSDDCLNDISEEKVFKSIAINNSKFDNDFDVNFVGTTLKDFEKLEKINVLESSNIDSFQENGIIISKKTSKNFNFSLGDKISIDILNRKAEFEIIGIATDTGFFGYDTDEAFTVFGSEDLIREYLGVSDKLYSNIYIENSSDNLNEWISDFNSKNNNVVAALTVDENSINGQLGWLKLTLFFMLAIILIMTIFIISSTFKLIITERLSTIGTFMSQGATLRRIISLILIESSCYGFLGGILGCVGGLFTTRIITNFANPLEKYGISVEQSINIKYFCISFLFAIIMSLISAYGSVGEINKLQIKDVILNANVEKKDKSKRKYTIGLISILISALLFCVDSKINYAGAMPSLFLFIVGLILIIPIIIDIIITGINKLNNRSSVILMLALNNVKSSTFLKSTTTLITVCIIAIIMMLSLSKAILFTINSAYSQMYYDIEIQIKSKNFQQVEDVLNDFKSDGSIKETIGITTIHTSLEGNATKKIDVYCVDPKTYIDFEDYMRYDDKKKQLEKIDKEKEGIIVSKLVSKNYGINVGDKITLQVENKEVELNVLSIIDARMFANGNYNIITKETAKELFGVNHSTDYYLRQGSDDPEFLEKLKDNLKSLGVSVLTKDELIEQQEDEISRLVDILNFITLLTILIGAISCMSNISINFMRRRKEIAVMNSIGLSNGRCIAMLLIEGIIQALLACLIAFISSLVIDVLFVGVYKFLDMDLEFRFPVNSAGIILVSSIGLVIILSITTILKSRKLNIIEEIKYE